MKQNFSLNFDFLCFMNLFIGRIWCGCAYVNFDFSLNFDFLCFNNIRFNRRQERQFYNSNKLIAIKTTRVHFEFI